MTAATAPSGEQLRIASGGREAIVTSVGAAVRAFRADGRDVFVPFGADERMPRFHGAMLAPWPNRIANGTYTFDGVEHRLSLTEPERGHALHGLLVWHRWHVLAHEPTRVVLHGTIVEQPGYPWTVDVVVEHAIDGGALHTRVTATNRSTSTAPFGVGGHPWIAVEGGLDTATLRCPADRFLATARPRMLPLGIEPVPPALDFRARRRVESTTVDDAFLLPERHGDRATTVVGADGFGVRLEPGEGADWVQLCTWDEPGTWFRRAIAIEPMTCPPGAFAHGIGVATLAPGSSRSWSWRYVPVLPSPAEVTVPRARR